MSRPPDKAVVIMAVLTTLVTPVLLKRIYSGMPP